MIIRYLCVFFQISGFRTSPVEEVSSSQENSRPSSRFSDLEKNITFSQTSSARTSPQEELRHPFILLNQSSASPYTTRKAIVRDVTKEIPYEPEKNGNQKFANSIGSTYGPESPRFQSKTSKASIYPIGTNNTAKEAFGELKNFNLQF